MNIEPAAYIVFFLAWSSAAALIAYVWYAYTEHRRYAALVFGALAAFVFGMVGVLIAAQWNDATAASSLLHQRVYSVALGCAGLALSVLIGLKVYGSRVLATAWRVCAGLTLFVLGVALGTADLVDAAFADIVRRFSSMFFLMPVLWGCRPRAVDARPIAAAPTRRSPQPSS